MRKILSIALSLVLFVTTFTLVLPEDVQARSREYMKVGLKYGSTANSSYDLSFPNGIVAAEVRDSELDEIREYPDLVRATAAYQDGSLFIKGYELDGTEVDITLEDSDVNCLMATDYLDDGYFSYDGSKYRGGAYFVYQGGSFNFVNYVEVDKYLYSVLQAEMGRSCPSEALKAQAVAARSFALCQKNTHKSQGFDICSSSHCQNYKGMANEYPETTKAVEDIAGEVLKYNGKTVSGYYFKNSGGYTQNSQDVWSGKEGYLQAVKDKYSPDYSWQTSYTFSQLEDKLSSAGKSVGTLESVAIADRNESGAAAKVVFKGSSGTATFEKDKIRTFFGSSQVKSTMFSFGEGILSSGPVTTSVGSESKGAGSEQAYAAGLGYVSPLDIQKDIYIMGGSGGKAYTALKDTYVYLENSGKSALYGGEGQSQEDVDLGNTSDISYGPQLVIKGKGYGHGIGMPQDSAIEMAKQGFSYRDILEFYYTDIEIK